MLKAIVFSFCILLVNTFFQNQVQAAKDKTKPTVTVKVKSNSPSKTVKVTITAKDESGIRAVKYAYGNLSSKEIKKCGTDLKLTKSTATISLNKNGTYTFYVQDKAGNVKLKKITISNVDITSPSLKLSKDILNQAATIHIKVSDTQGEIKKLLYCSGRQVIDSSAWKNAKDITGVSDFVVNKSGNYSVKAIDLAGNETVKTIHVQLELKAVWISYLEFSSAGYTESAFRTHVQTMFDNVVDLHMNAVIVQVRPFSDAMYPSKYFPWSKYVSGSQGKDPGFDPLKIMVEEAHKRNLEFHAWLNPYRVTTNSTDVSILADSHPAKKWLTDEDTENDRNVLKFNKSFYYNPASSEVQKLIVNGVKEIVKNYDVDGIHFDDYFYPTLGTNHKKVFDSVEYNTYKKNQEAAGKTVLSIPDWRRNNVNKLVKSVYSAIKKIDETCEFGISPFGNPDNLRSDLQYYVDVDTWLSKDGYVDYICPQLYWSFQHSTCAYDKLLKRWIDIRKNSVKIYVGIANYRAGSNLETQWKDSSILADMITCARETGCVDGFMFFRYAFFYNKVCEPAVEELLPLLEDN